MVQKRVHCPICRKETVWENNPFRPFCSKRCRLVDLGKWAKGDYRIPGEKKDAVSREDDKKNTSEK